MRLKASWIAWVFFGFVCLGVIQNVINVVSNPKPGTDSFGMAGDLVVEDYPDCFRVGWSTDHLPPTAPT